MPNICGDVEKTAKMTMISAKVNLFVFRTDARKANFKMPTIMWWSIGSRRINRRKNNIYVPYISRNGNYVYVDAADMNIHMLFHHIVVLDIMMNSGNFLQGLLCCCPFHSHSSFHELFVEICTH